MICFFIFFIICLSNLLLFKVGIKIEVFGLEGFVLIIMEFGFFLRSLFWIKLFILVIFCFYVNCFIYFVVKCVCFLWVVFEFINFVIVLVIFRGVGLVNFIIFGGNIIFVFLLVSFIIGKL